MIPIFIILKKFRGILKKSFVKVSIALILIIIYGTLSEYYMERNAPGSGIKSLFDSLWFIMQTVTTVGYGDTPIVTFWGRINAMLIMLFGIGMLGLFAASFASVMIEYSLAKRYGERKTKMKSHILICNWNAIAEELVSEISLEGEKVLLLAPLNTAPLPDLEFVKGSCLSLKDLDKAGVEHSKTAVVLAETLVDGEYAKAIDAKTILGVMNIKKKNPSIHVVAEILDSDSVENAKFVGSDEIVVRGKVSAKLLARGALDPGTVDILENILTAGSGEEIYEDPLPEWMHGKKYQDVAKYMFDQHAIPIALRGVKGLKVNPAAELVIDHDSIIYIAHEKVKFL